jgi:hypothetical protein
MAKFHVEMLGNSEVLKSRSIEILPEVDRSTFIRSIESSQNLLL